MFCIIDCMEHNNAFDFNTANLVDQITVIGNCEHLYFHANKSASVCENKNEALFYMTLAGMTTDFRRYFMREHFPEVGEKDWCVLKAVETLRQRIYESASASQEDLARINEIWTYTTEHIFGIDLSGCAVCRTDKEEPLKIDTAPKVEL